MEEKIRKIVNLLIEQNKTISTMESCTGGFIASSITNIEGSSQVIKFSAVTYSNEFKIKMGVSKEIIDKYSVYSIETANEMSKKISDFTNSNYAIGITGKLNRIDENNLIGNNNEVFISIYDKDNDIYYANSILLENQERKECKEIILEFITDKLLEILSI